MVKVSVSSCSLSRADRVPMSSTPSSHCWWSLTVSYYQPLYTPSVNLETGHRVLIPHALTHASFGQNEQNIDIVYHSDQVFSGCRFRPFDCLLVTYNGNMQRVRPSYVHRVTEQRWWAFPLRVWSAAGVMLLSRCVICKSLYTAPRVTLWVYSLTKRCSCVNNSRGYRP